MSIDKQHHPPPTKNHTPRQPQNQADPEQPPPAAEAALQSRRACATALPAQVAQGMLWVWPDTSPEGLAASKVSGLVGGGMWGWVRWMHKR